MSANTLETFLDPVDRASFLSDYWERRPLHIERATPGYFADVYDVADIEESLVAGARDLERFALVKAGGPEASPSEYVVARPPIRGLSAGRPPTPTVDPRKVVALFEAGYTLVIKDAALLSARLQRVCNRLQQELGAFVGANVYLTPPGAQGFELHHDSHDTLTLQIDGNKTWRVYEPAIELPLESQTLNRDTPRPALALHAEIPLSAGDTLYLPRGYAHEAVASGEGRALHVTFALAPVRVVDVLHAALDAAAVHDTALRGALPVGWAGDDRFIAAFSTRIAERAARIFAHPAIERASRMVLEHLFAASRSEASGAFDGIAALPSIGADTLLRASDHQPLLVRKGSTTIELLLPGRSLTIPAACATALDQLRAGALRFADLDLPMPEPDRLAFVRAMIREGIVRIEVD